ncbi:hypothetical protein NKG05_00825 [Oerskovia sp. M15]
MAAGGSAYGMPSHRSTVLQDTLGDSLRHTRPRQLAGQTLTNVERMTREEHPGELVKTHPVALHRDDTGVTDDSSRLTAESSNSCS